MKCVDYKFPFSCLLFSFFIASLFAQSIEAKEILSDNLRAVKDVRTGKTVKLGGGISLISFLDLEQIECEENCDKSKSQLVMLKSINKQYADNGVKVYIVIVGDKFSQSQLINFTYNWSLDSIIVVNDADMTLQNQFKVDSLPSTLLFDKNKHLVKRWTGHAAIASMSFAVKDII